MRICLVYDCLFPYTVGGAERWYRNLGERLAADGHEVTYLTLRQWVRGEQAEVPGVRVVAVGPRMALYAGSGRRILPPLVFGLGVLAHLLRHGRRYDAVHTASFPYFSLLAARLALTGAGVPVYVDWFEVWSRDYWRSYLGCLGWVGWLVQRACIRLSPHAFAFSRLHARRLRDEGLRHQPTLLAGLYAGGLELRVREGAREPLVVFAGRHIPEKRVPLAVEAVAVAARRVPGLRGLILGDGPDRPRVLAAIASAGAGAVIDAPGFVSTDAVGEALERAACLLLPSIREGYGLVVVEAAAAGTPSIVVPSPDNAAVELVQDGVNGVVAAGDAVVQVADAIVRAVQGGDRLRASTARWFEANAGRLTAAASIETIIRTYDGSGDGARRG